MQSIAHSLPQKGDTAVDVIWPFQILARKLEVFGDKKLALLHHDELSGSNKLSKLFTLSLGSFGKGEFTQIKS